jgi:replicative DNA helicase
VGDRLPPHSVEAEQGVLGCCLLDPKEALGLAMERIGAKEVFFDLRHQALFATLTEMVNEGRMVDPITLKAYLEEREARVEGNRVTLLEGIGGMNYIGGLMNVPSASACEYYLSIVMERYRLRQMLRVLAEAQGRIWEWDGEVDTLINSIETSVLEAGEEGATKEGIKPMSDVLKRTMDLVENCFHRGKGIIDGVATGFSYLDKMLGGLHNGEYFVLGARPSCGKTALMMNIVKHVVKVQKRKVGVFSVEMQDTALCLRLWCDVAGVNMQQVRTGFATHRDMERLGGARAGVGEVWDFVR